MVTRLRIILLCFMGSILLFSSFTTFDTTCVAASVTKLPSPELVSVTYKDLSYDVPASTTTDPFTGKQVEIPGHHVENRTLTIVINKNNIPSDSHLYYKIRMKGSFSNDWFNITGRVVPDPDSPLTTLVFTSPSNPWYEGAEGKLSYESHSFYLPSEGRADFQICAEIWGYELSDYSSIAGSSKYVEVLEAASDWSNIKTIDMGQYANIETPNQSKPVSSQTSTDQTGDKSGATLTGLSFTVIALLVILCSSILVLSVAFVREKKRHVKDDI